MNDPNQLSTTFMKNRLDKIKENHLQTAQDSSSSIDQDTTPSRSFSYTSLSTTLTNDNNPMPMPMPISTLNTSLHNHLSIQSQEDIVTSFQQNASKATKDKFGFFINEASEMFQKYEKEIKELKHQSLYFPPFKLHVISSSISLSLCPSNEAAFMHQMKKRTESEQYTINEICSEYNKKMSELFKQNDDLTKMIDKISFDVINKLQEKIQRLGELYEKEKKEKEKAAEQLRSLDCIFQQNSDIKESNIEKDKCIIDLHETIEVNQKLIDDLNIQNNTLAEMLVTFKNNVEEQDKTGIEQNKTISELKEKIDSLEEIIEHKEKVIKEKDDEMRLLIRDNVQWEEKYTLQSKEVDNYKRWSLWDGDLAESYKKIDQMNKEIHTLTKDNEDLVNTNQRLAKENEAFVEESKDNKERISLLKSENDSLLIIKYAYEKDKDKLENYDGLYTENVRLKREQNAIVERYESQIKTNQKNHESQLLYNQSKNDKNIQAIKNQYEKDLTTKGDIIQGLEDKIQSLNKEKEELAIQVDKKHQMTLNLKEAYDNLSNKYKTQEEKIQSLEKAQANPVSSSNTINITDNNNQGTKVYSTYDKYAFTKEILIDYLFCLYLYESSISIQNLTDHLLGNLNLYLNTLFQKQSNNQPASFLSELLEDIFFLSFDKLHQRKLLSKSPDALSFTINFEQFNRTTIHEICKDISINNPLMKFKSRKSLEQLIGLFTSKYENSFDFDDDFPSYLNDEIVPSVTARIDKYQHVIFDDLHTLVEMSLNNIKEGRIIVNDIAIYSYQNYHSQYRNVTYNEEKGVLTIIGELKQREAIDNVICRMKHREVKQIELNRAFDKNNESVLIRLLTIMLVHIPKIECIRLKENALDGRVFREHVNPMIKLFKELKVLDLTYNGLNDDDIKLLCETIKNNTSIEQLILNSNKITSASGFYIADTLAKNTTITSLRLNSNQLNDSGLGSLFNVLSNTNTTLTSLSIGDNALSKDDLLALGEYLNTNPVLRSLDISGNNIDVKTATNLSISLKKARNLKSLNVNLTNLNEESCPLFINYLNETELTELSMDKNVFGDTGAIIFVNKIKLCPHLERVSLKMCAITPMFLSLIGNVFKTSSQLKEINLESNMFDDSDLLVFCQIIVSNPGLIAKFSKNGLMDKTLEIISKFPNIVLV